MELKSPRTLWSTATSTAGDYKYLTHDYNITNIIHKKLHFINLNHRVKHYKDVGGTHGSTFGNENTKAVLEEVILGRTQ